ncbi:isochorismatase family protein [Paraburkholderia silvatlantica]|uniref:Nicotinamidase-related amidase n=1 Tax=Paraburkholderia silvatlantica TaxID=321895 RepID=A0ABR6FJP2_9BURK|nr:isochorismatase family protein [Paraburkholderia silvatlantica]MBB2927655.1 nicotinamidase-related amidase [Paraburkholderia silvatlantica]PVY36364.1 nicotinamidase-related amidase [Paraburkholderia silvatlantica]PXW40219.1 nicotinamidase-related amidase [Paraburkholderia silvatlantica]
MLHSLSESIVVLIDLQTGLVPAIRDGESIVAQAVRLGRIARDLDVPVIGTEQNPGALGENAKEIKDLCSITVAKHHFDATADGLFEALPRGRTRAIVAGCEAHVCVLQTAVGLLQRGLSVTLVTDAMGSRKVVDKEVAISRLNNAGAEVATVEMVAFEWLRSSRHPRFRDILQLIK